MDVSIIIVNYNTCELTLQCLRSVYEKTVDVCFEVIVIDNASVDNSVKRIQTEFPQVTLLEAKENLGFGRANNLGYKYAIGKYIFLLNSDTVLLNNSIKELIDFASVNTNIGALGGLLFDNNGEITHFSGHFPRMKDVLFRSFMGYVSFLGFKIDSKANKKVDIDKTLCLKVDYITGADLFIPRIVIEKIGFFDEKFFMYYEETDLQKRMEYYGLKRLVLTRSRILHLEGASLRSHIKSNKSKTIITKSLFVYMKKHKPKIGYYCFRIIYLVLSLPHLFNYSYPIKQRFNFLKVLIGGVV